jgi:hypothetical protein
MTRDGYLKNHTDVGPRDFANVDYIAASRLLKKSVASALRM